MLITRAFFRSLQREDHVGIVLEPVPTFKNGIHRTVEIDLLRFRAELVLYHDALQRIAAHGIWIASWYDRKTDESA